MADQNPTDRSAFDPFSSAEDDRSTESAVLGLLLAEHPTRLTEDELGLVLHGNIDLFEPRDAAERAVQELVGAGLVHREGKFLSPTRAALYFDALGR